MYVFFTLIRPVGAPKAQAGKDGMVWVRSMYGFGPSTDEQLLSPSSVAIAPNGDVYATDLQRARIMIFGPDGTFRRLLHTGAGGTQRGMFIRPESIDVGENGDVYIADSWANKIIVFGSDGKFSREWPTEVQARGVGVVKDRVYVLDVGRVLVFDTQGKKLAAFGSRGPNIGQIDAYQGITGRDGIVYITDPYNKRLQAFDENGTVRWAVPKSAQDTSTPNAKWDLPQDLVFDGSGRLVVVDAFNFTIDVVDPKTGEILTKYGDYGAEDGQFFYPTSIDYDPVRNWFAIADTNNNRVQIVRIPGSANPNAAALWRALASPYRYLAIPLILLLLAVVFGVLMTRRAARRIDAGNTEEFAKQTD